MTLKKERSYSRENETRPLFADAADLLLKCAGYMDDRSAALQEDNELCLTTYYAIDNDVIALYLEPELMSKYLELFGERKDTITTRSLAFLLGDFLFKSSEPLIPGHEKQQCRFLIIPPHDEELIRTLNAIHRKLSSTIQHVTTDAFDKLSNIFMEFGENNNDQNLLSALRQHVPALVELYNPYKGAKAALERFATLPDTVFQRIDSFLENGFTFPLLDSVNNEEDRAISNILIDRWEIELKQVAPRHKPGYAIRGDAEVLATIEHINSNINVLRKQVVLITGSQSLIAAAEKRKPWGDEGPSFAEMYIRHPQAFLAHPKFFLLEESGASTSENLKDEKASFRLIDWLTLFFPAGLRPDIQLQVTVVRKFLKAIKTSKYINIFAKMSNFGKDMNSNKLLDGWKSQVSSAAEMQYSGGLNLAEERGALELAKKLLELKNNASWSLDKLRELILKESLISISALYSSTALWVGLWNNIDRKVSKAVPALRFDDNYQVVEIYSNQLIKLLLEDARKEATKASKATLGELHELSKNVEAVDPSLYHAHIVHALAFAAKGHWNATLTLANTALTICDNIDPEERGVRRGREAAYLACVAARRSANDQSGLQEAKKYLDSAIKRENEGWDEDIRFAAERLILETRILYFKIFCDLESVDQNSIVSLIDEFIKLNTVALSEENELIRLWVQRQIYTHLFTLLLVAHKLQPADLLIEKYNIVSLLKVFKSVLDNIDAHNHKPEDDPYAHLIYFISTLYWNDCAEEIEKNRTEANSLLDALEPHMPYDLKRFQFLKHISDCVS